MNCLVTGGAGFIGSNLVNRLVSLGHNVEVVDDFSNGHLEFLDQNKFRVTPADLLPSFLEAKSDLSDIDVLVIDGDFSHENVLARIVSGVYDIVFHQAAIPRVLFSVENPSETTHTNIGKTVSLFEACINNVDRIVFASSSSVYGGPDTMPIKESAQKNPRSPYAWQKSAIEDCSKVFGELYDLDIVCLRYFNAFGPNQLGDSPYSTAVSAWCNNTRDGKPLRSDGDGTQSRDLCYVDNIVAANILAATSDKKFYGKCYNIACGDRTTNNQILDYFRNNFSHTVVTKAPWRPGDVMHTQADISLARDDLGYDPKVTFWDGLDKTIAWWGIKDERSK